MHNTEASETVVPGRYRAAMQNTEAPSAGNARRRRDTARERPRTTPRRKHRCHASGAPTHDTGGPGTPPATTGRSRPP
jgi:hypothetical protein